MEAREGVGLKRLQFTISMSISCGRRFVFLSNSSMHPNKTISASFLADSIPNSGGVVRIPGGKYVSLPSPVL